MGENEKGQLGDSTYEDKIVPVPIVSSGIVAVAAGWRHSLFVKDDGSLWVMGSNDDGQLGDGAEWSKSEHPPTHNKPFQIADGLSTQTSPSPVEEASPHEGWMYHKWPWVFNNADQGWCYYYCTGNKWYVWRAKYKRWYRFDSSDEKWKAM